jgi:hypothetical protein
MAINPKWARWAFASVVNHFQNNLDTTRVPIFVEGEKRNTDTLKTFAEVRMDGPFFTEVSRDCYKIEGEVNILIQATLDEMDAQLIHRSVGLVTAAFSDISVYRFGDEPGDDNSFVWCWKLINDSRRRERVQVSHFGVIEPNTKLTQATVEAHYDVFLDAS